MKKQSGAPPPGYRRIEQNGHIFCSISHIVSKPLLPAGIGGNMVADWREQVKIEQNNCYCSIRAANVVYGAGAAKRPVSQRWQRITKPACVTTVHDQALCGTSRTPSPTILLPAEILKQGTAYAVPCTVHFSPLPFLRGLGAGVAASASVRTRSVRS